MSTPRDSDPAPGEDVFTEDDLAPDSLDSLDSLDIKAMRNMRIDRGLVVIAVSALGLWVGGIIALGACAAPMVFEFTPHPFSGRAMGAAFMRFDSIAIGCSVVVLGCEVVRTLLTMKERSQALMPRVRRYFAIAMAAGAVFLGMRLSPEIMRLHEAGVRRGIGVDGEHLQAIHAQAELIAKILVPMAFALIALHILTLQTTTPNGQDD
jgi:hypothetical protein